MSVPPEKNGEPGGSHSGNPDSTMTAPPGKPSGENVPPAGGESMAPADSKHPNAPPGGLEKLEKNNGG